MTSFRILSCWPALCAIVICVVIGLSIRPNRTPPNPAQVVTPSDGEWRDTGVEAGEDELAGGPPAPQAVNAVGQPGPGLQGEWQLRGNTWWHRWRVGP